MIAFMIVVIGCGGGGGGGGGCIGIHRQGSCRVVSIFHLRCFARIGLAFLGLTRLLRRVDADTDAWVCANRNFHP